MHTARRDPTAQTVSASEHACDTSLYESSALFPVVVAAAVVVVAVVVEAVVGWSGTPGAVSAHHGGGRATRPEKNRRIQKNHRMSNLRLDRLSENEPDSCCGIMPSVSFHCWTV